MFPRQIQNIPTPVLWVPRRLNIPPTEYMRAVAEFDGEDWDEIVTRQDGEEAQAALVGGASVTSGGIITHQTGFEYQVAMTGGVTTDWASVITRNTATETCGALAGEASATNGTTWTRSPGQSDTVGAQAGNPTETNG